MSTGEGVVFFFGGLLLFGFGLAAGRVSDDEHERKAGRCEMRCELSSHDTGELRDGQCVCVDSTPIGGSDDR